MSKTIYIFSSSAVIFFNLYFMVNGDIEYNTINEDGSYRFGHRNDDFGGYYHSASGTPDNVVRGRYGSRNPATGNVEETVYTAGPRGFRVTGPKVHRKTNLDQYPPRAIGSPDDPLADPYDDPSYSFSYRTADQSRSEENDATGRVRGLYSFLDDEGVRHSVRYAAGAGTGFEVTNSVPDNPIDVGYTGPLYKAPPETRGKMTVQRGPDGTYKLLAAGPDHRRAESRSPDGLVRGTYSFLDDKGVQRTVEYIAGAGIGYRVVKNKVGPGTHVNNQVLDFRLNDATFKLANDFGTGAGPGAELGGSSGGSVGGAGGGAGGRRGNKGRIGGGASSTRDYAQSSAGRVDADDNQIASEDDAEGDGATSGRNSGSGGKTKAKENRIGIPKNGGRGGGNGGSSNRGGSTKDRDFMHERGYTRNDGKGRNPANSGKPLNNNKRKPSRGQSTTSSRNRPGSPVSSDGGNYNYDPPGTNSNNYDANDDDYASALPPLVTANHKILEIDRERDWVERHRDSTIIKNVGKWYLGLPPGQSVRAHVQNIDILPLGGRRVPSPSEALRRDELADMTASSESESDPYRS
ncbi:uncharacterized protein LOC111683423 [Lucilia cuprina]|uniref:uncharacterized protein LOC111683423 n=1 Tax=Lucilia cuprina TaxID=7375 RepID=UPI001F070C38|nr:uncharacterized protein LOC111683423 [Lucilia cuprina]